MKATEHPVYDDLRFLTQIIDNNESTEVEVEVAINEREKLLQKLRLN